MFLVKKKRYFFNSLCALFAMLILTTSCARPDITVPKSKYNSETLSKDWRSNVIENQKRNNNNSYNQPYAYPRDNDAHYIPPKYEYKLVPTQPQQQHYNPPPNPYSSAPYPQDNDKNYSTDYPTYDPDADNSSYYYLNKDKTLPPPRKVDPYGSEQYDYPIYFD
jgi:hypothetical protein